MGVEKSKNKKIQIYINLYSFSFLVTSLLVNLKSGDFAIENYNAFEIVGAILVLIPCSISFADASGFYEKQLGQLKMSFPILLGIVASYFIWVVL